METNQYRQNAWECLKQANASDSAQDREALLEAATKWLWLSAVLNRMAARQRRIDRRREGF